MRIHDANPMVRSLKRVGLCAAAALIAATSPARAAATDNGISSVEVTEAPAGGRVIIHGSKKPSFTVFKLAEPARVVVDLAGADVTKVPTPIDTKAPGVAGVTTAQFDEGGKRVARIVVALDGEPRYDVAATGNDLVVAVTAPPKPAAPAQAEAPKTAETAPPADPNVVVSRTDEKEVEHAAGKLEAVSASGTSEVATVRVQTDGDVGTYSLIELKNPGRLALDLPGVTLAKKGMKARGAGPVKSVRVARHEGGVRVVVDGAGDKLPAYQIDRVQSGLTVRVGQAKVAALAKAEPPKAAPVAVAIEKPKPEVAPIKAALRKLAQVKAVDLVNEGGESKVVIALDGDATYTLVRNDATTATITLTGAALPARLERNVDASALGGNVTMVSSYRAPGHAETVKVVATLREGVKSSARKSGGRITWAFAGNKASAQVAMPAALAGATASEQRAQTSASVLDSANYTGRRVDFNVKDMDIRNLLTAISEISRRNIIIADDVQGKVTIKLRNVPWDQALDIILRAKGLGREEVGNIIRVAPLTTLRNEQKEAADAQKITSSLEPVKVRLIPVNYAKAEAMVAQLKDSLTDRGTVSVDARTNTIIVKDVPDALSRAEGIVRTLDTATPEVLIEARIVEASTSFQRQAGIQWGGAVSFSPAFGNPTGLIFPNILNVAGAADDPAAPLAGLNGITQPNFAVNMPAPIGLNNGAGLGFVFGSAGGAANLNLRLSAAENSGTIKTISSPRVVTIDNVEASVSQGVQIPYSQISAAGVNTTFVEANLQLRVTPHVTQEGAIQLRISASNNQPNPQLTGANGQPSITRREAKTEVLVHDGDTTVIGGIYTRRNSEAWNEVPVLGRIPILGWLFKKKAVTDDRTELLIFITPRIVNRSQSAMTSREPPADDTGSDKQ